MLHLSRRLPNPNPCLRSVILQLRFARTDSGSPGHTRRRSKLSARTMRKVDEKSEWWLVDGEMHEIGDNVPPRERFVIPRDNIPNKRRKQLREQFMRRTRLVIKETEHEPWCKKYIELYQELRENWERLYWDEGYSKKLAQDHANYESAEDDDLDFSPYRRRWNQDKQIKGQELGTNREADSWERVNQIRDKFEYDRDRRMREKAFAPMTSGTAPGSDHSISRNQRFDTQRYFPQSGGIAPGSDDSVSRNQHFDTERQFPQSGGMAPGSDHLVSRNRHFDTQRHFPMSGGTAPLGSDHRHFPHSGRIAPPGSDHSVSRNQRFDNQRYFPQSGEMVPGSDDSVSRNQR